MKNSFSQTNSSSINIDTNKNLLLANFNGDSVSELKTDQKAVLQNFSILHSRNYFQFIKDQFPSFIVMKFEGIQRELQYQKPIKRKDENWKFWLSLTMLALLALIKYAYHKDFDELRLTFKNWGMNQQAIRELGIGVPLGTVLLNIFSVISISFYIFIVIDHYQAIIINPSWLQMILTTTGVLAALLLRFVLLKMSEIIFPFRKEVALFNYYELQINRVMGILLFPFSLLIAFGLSVVVNASIIISLMLIVSMLMIRYVKGFNIGYAYFGGYVIHFLLYICALEIAPILVITRLLLNIEPIRFSI